MKLKINFYCICLINHYTFSNEIVCTTYGNIIIFDGILYFYNRLDFIYKNICFFITERFSN